MVVADEKVIEADPWAAKNLEASPKAERFPTGQTKSWFLFPKIRFEGFSSLHDRHTTSFHSSTIYKLCLPILP